MIIFSKEFIQEKTTIFLEAMGTALEQITDANSFKPLSGNNIEEDSPLEEGLEHQEDHDRRNFIK